MKLDRADLAALLIDESLLVMHEGQSGWWRGNEFVSFYEILENYTALQPIGENK